MWGVCGCVRGGDVGGDVCVFCVRRRCLRDCVCVRSCVELCGVIGVCGDVEGCGCLRRSYLREREIM